MAQMCFTNATRCSNIRNMTADDVDKAVDSPTIKTAKEINSTLYKTSIFYGKKIILFPLDIFQELKSYLLHIRPHFIHPDNEYVFTSLGNKGVSEPQMKHNLVSKCLSKTFEKSNALKDNPLAAVSPNRIRTDVATEMVARQGINVDTLATSFMKHKADTCNKYYLVNWSHRESARIAMQCFNMFSMIDETERITSELL